MYSGSTLRPFKHIDTWLGAHQKIDRLAYTHLRKMTSVGEFSRFPLRRQVLQFEGRDGPDGVKTKTPAQDEPWHYYNPHNPEDTKILKIIEGHYEALTKTLAEGNKTRAGFEAAWLAHALVDGLTPAHHFPYEEELVKLRGGKGIETRNTPKEKLLMHGDTLGQKVHNNWQMWGEKGLLSTHIAFEVGVAVLLLPSRRIKTEPTEHEKVRIAQIGYLPYFTEVARAVADMKLYDTFYQSGWTPALAKSVRRQLVPKIVSTVALVWREALLEAGERSA